MNDFQPIATYTGKSTNHPSRHFFVTDGVNRAIGWCINGVWKAAPRQFGTITHYAPIVYPPLPSQPEFALK